MKNVSFPFLIYPTEWDSLKIRSGACAFGNLLICFINTAKKSTTDCILFHFICSISLWIFWLIFWVWPWMHDEKFHRPKLASRFWKLRRPIKNLYTKWQRKQYKWQNHFFPVLFECRKKYLNASFETKTPIFFRQNFFQSKDMENSLSVIRGWKSIFFLCLPTWKIYSTENLVPLFIRSQPCHFPNPPFLATHLIAKRKEKILETSFF